MIWHLIMNFMTLTEVSTVRSVHGHAHNVTSASGYTCVMTD